MWRSTSRRYRIRRPPDVKDNAPGRGSCSPRRGVDMHVQALWRYPVKSMRGERLTETTLKMNCIQGDRNIVVVSKSRGNVVTARTHPGLLGLQATVSANGVTMIEEHLSNSREALALTLEAAQDSVRVVDAGERTERFDLLPLLAATDGAIKELGIDFRHLRPNVVIGGVKGQAESLARRCSSQRRTRHPGRAVENAVRDDDFRSCHTSTGPPRPSEIRQRGQRQVGSRLRRSCPQRDS